MNKIDFIESERLSLEPISLKFLTKNYLGWLNDQEVYKYLESGGDYTLANLKEYILGHQMNKSLFWAILIKSSNSHIGNIKIDPVDEEKKTAELGIMIGEKNEWGKGYAYEAISTIEEYCLKQLRLNTITLGLKKSNKNALKLYQKLGYIEYDRERYPEVYNNSSPQSVRMYKNICNKKLILGTVQLGKEYGINNSTGILESEESHRILDTAYENNIRLLDTAEAYGKSHKIIGEFHEKFPNKKFKIISKLNPTLKIENHNLEEHVLNMMDDLSVDYIHGYMIHDYNHLKINNSLYDELDSLKNNKLINLTGISLYNFSDIIDILENYNFDFIQIPFNILSNKKKFDKIFKISSDNGIKIFARSVFLQGLFFSSESNFPKKLLPLKKYIGNLQSYCEKNNIGLNELALNYVTKNSSIDQVIVGVDNLSQLVNNIKISISTHNIQKSFTDRINVNEESLLNPSNW